MKRKAYIEQKRSKERLAKLQERDDANSIVESLYAIEVKLATG